MSNEAIDIEQEFISHLADQTSLEYILREGVTNELLLTTQSKKMYEFVQDHFSQTGKMASTKVLGTEFPDYTFEEPEGTVNWVVDKLRERYQRNQINDLTLELAERSGKPKEAMQYLREQTLEIERNSLSSRHVWQPGDHKLFLRDLQQQVLQGHYKGVSIGFKDIDDYTGGTKKGGVSYIMARPKRMKTFFVLNAFIQQVLADEEPYLSTLENTEQEIMLRISCMLSGFPWDKAQKGQFMSKDWKTLEKAWDTFSQHKFYIEMPPLDERTVSQIFLKADKYEAGPVLISQFRYLKGTKDWYSAEHQEHAEIAVDLKRAATKPGFERPVIVEAQFNRGGDSMADLEDFDPSKVGLTDMIPQSADTLYGLFQSKDMRANNQTEFGILEARNHGKAAWFIRNELKTHTELDMIPGSQH